PAAHRGLHALPTRRSSDLSKGGIGQWFMVRGDDGQAELKNVRSFKLGDSAITQILPEERRKGFLALDDSGSLGIFHSTAHRTLLDRKSTRLNSSHVKISYA